MDYHKQSDFPPPGDSPQYSSRVWFDELHVLSISVLYSQYHILDAEGLRKSARCSETPPLSTVTCRVLDPPNLAAHIIQYSTVQYSIVRYSTVQYSIV